MTIQEFRENPALVKWARETFEQENFKLLMEALREIAPVRFLPSADVTPHFAHIQLGQQTGWAQYEEMMLSAAKRFETPQQMPEPNYPNEPDPEPEEEA